MTAQLSVSCHASQSGRLGDEAAEPGEAAPAGPRVAEPRAGEEGSDAAVLSFESRRVTAPLLARAASGSCLWPERHSWLGLG